MKNNVAYFRILKGYSQDYLAQEAHISRPHLSEIENCKVQNIGGKTMSNIAAALGRTVQEVFFDQSVKHKQHIKKQNAHKK